MKSPRKGNAGCDSKPTLTFRSFRQARIQTKLLKAKEGLDLTDTISDRISSIEDTLQDWKRTRSLSRESTHKVSLNHNLVKASPLRTRSANRALYSTSSELVKLAQVAQTLLTQESFEEDTEEGCTNTKFLRSLHVSHQTKSDKEKEEENVMEQERGRQSTTIHVPVFRAHVAPLSPEKRVHTWDTLNQSARIESMKCQPKVLIEQEVFPEPTLPHASEPQSRSRRLKPGRL